MADVLLVINSGSSSIKLSIFTCHHPLSLLYHGQIENRSKSTYLSISNVGHQQILKQTISSRGIKAGLSAFFAWFDKLPDCMTLTAVGHRIAHGGQYFLMPTLVNDDVIKKIASLIPWAPYHQPENLEAIQIIKQLYPNLPQLACFDTTFHQTQEKLATLFAIPKQLTDEGVHRYGFHGISYEYISSIMNQYIGDIGNKRVIVAHLGSGASLCAMHQHKSVATSMGMTALDGLMMASRCGTIDPGVLLYLLQEKKWSVEQVSILLYQEAGLLGVSGISSDMRDLESNNDPDAIQAVNLFCYMAAKELTALCTILQGCDAIIFTAGIGEKSIIVRKKICEHLKWLGVILDEKANASHSPIISRASSTILVSVIPTNEEYMIATHINRMIGA